MHSETAGLEYREITAYAAGLISKVPLPISDEVQRRHPTAEDHQLATAKAKASAASLSLARSSEPSAGRSAEGSRRPPTAATRTERSRLVPVASRGVGADRGLRPSLGLHKAASGQTSRYDGSRPTALSGSSGDTAARVRGEEPACVSHSEAQRLRPQGARDCALR